MFKRRKWLIRLLILLVIGGLLFWNSRGPSIEEDSFLVLDLSGNYVEGRPSGPFGQLLQSENVLIDVLDNIRKARQDGRIKGVIVRIGDLGAGWAQTTEIRDALALVRAEGKSVTALIELELVVANKEFYLASVADRIFVPEAGAPLLNGLAANYMFLGGLWPKIDVTMQVEQIREYKTAGDSLSRESMSDAHRERANSILDSINAHYLQTLAAARNLMVDELQAVLDQGHASADELLEAGLIDGIAGFEEILASLGADGKDAKTVGEGVYSSVSLESLGLGGGPRIAIVHAAGTIVAGSSGGNPGSVGSRELSTALRAAAEDEEIKAIVMRVASPGGSPAGSDEIWQQVRAAAEKKPLVVSMGDVAASGGYYIAAGAERILASATTLTGSIGVVFYKPDVSGLLDRVGVHTESLSRGRYARLMDLTKRFDDEELTLIRSRMDSIYDLFLGRVASTRSSLDRDAVDRIGGGRVWTGAQAAEIGLVDEIGGLRDAIRAAAAAAGIHDVEKAELAFYPELGMLEQQLARVRRNSGAQAFARGIASALPGWFVSSATSLADYLELEPGAYALMPFLVEID